VVAEWQRTLVYRVVERRAFAMFESLPTVFVMVTEKCRRIEEARWLGTQYYVENLIVKPSCKVTEIQILAHDI